MPLSQMACTASSGYTGFAMLAVGCLFSVLDRQGLAVSVFMGPLEAPVFGRNGNRHAMVIGVLACT